LDLRFGHLDDQGVPKNPDWSEIHKYRQAKRESAAEDRRIKAKGLKEALQGQREGKAAKMEANKKDEKAREDQILDFEQNHYWNERDSTLGVLSEYLTQPDMEDDYTEAEQQKDLNPKSLNPEP